METSGNSIEEQGEKAMGAVMGIVAQSGGDTVLLGKLLEMIISFSVAILRCMHNDKYIEDFLAAAIKDTDNKIGIEAISVQ
jgi:hypothetical protein